MPRAVPGTGCVVPRAVPCAWCRGPGAVPGAEDCAGPSTVSTQHSTRHQHWHSTGHPAPRTRHPSRDDSSVREEPPAVGEILGDDVSTRACAAPDRQRVDGRRQHERLLGILKRRRLCTEWRSSHSRAISRCVDDRTGSGVRAGSEIRTFPSTVRRVEARRPSSALAQIRPTVRPGRSTLTQSSVHFTESAARSRGR